MMTASDIINKYIEFFEKRGHQRIPNAPLVPQNDPTTLFTSSGMQPLIPYLLGEPHPMGKELVNVQNCFRAQDIDEIGDNRHTTFFRMLGNWSLGDYFKKDQLLWFFDFLTDKAKGLKLDPTKLFISIFKGSDNAPKDTESELIWKEEIFNTVLSDFFKIGIKEITVNENPEKGIKETDRIFYYGVNNNWWSRSGTPDKMPVGEPGGPDSEVFFDFGKNLKIHESSSFKNQPCHPNCQCGRFLEIGNSVFMEYKKAKDGFFQPLPQKNVDFGGGLERLSAATNNTPDIFATDLYNDIIKKIEEYSGGDYSKPEHQKSIRIIADHLKAAAYMIASDITPSNKERGYVLRRLMRRAAVKMHQLKGGLTPIPGFEAILEEVLIAEENISQGALDRDSDRIKIFQVVREEMGKFGNSLDRGLKIFEKYDASQLNELNAFNLFQSYGFPFEIAEELFGQKGKKLDREKFDEAMTAHRELSRTASSGMFKGGLADNSEQTVREHTATHLLHKALRDLLGAQVHQTGSNITSERVRFDFNFERNLTPDELKKIEETVNQKIKENLPVHFEILPLQKAKETGAIGLFNEKYSDNVKVYFVGDYSKEFCGGPHVSCTSEIKSFRIIKQENIGKGNRRLYATVG